MRWRTARRALTGCSASASPRRPGRRAGAGALAVTVCHTQDIALIDPARRGAAEELNTSGSTCTRPSWPRASVAARPHRGRVVGGESPTEWVFKIRRGIAFHNGEPLNADAVKPPSNVTRRRTKSGTERLPSVKDVRRVDPYTVRITTPSRRPRFWSACSKCRSYPPSTSKQVGTSFVQKPVGRGRTGGWSGSRAATSRSRRTPKQAGGSRHWSGRPSS